MRTITLILACYNVERYVNECFEKSYVNNDDIEYLFIDDGSKDNSVKLAERFAAKHPNNVRVIKKQHSGVTDTYEVGMKEASGKFFFFLDIDDWVEKSVLLEASEIIKTNEQLDVLLYDYSTDFRSGKKSYITKLSKFVKDSQITCVEEFKKPPLPFYFMNHNALIRRDILVEHNYQSPDATLYSDSFIVLFALTHSKQVYYSKKILYHYIIGTTGQTTTLNNVTKNYKEYYKNITFLDHYFNDEMMKNLTRKKRKLIYHTVFLYFAMIYFVTFCTYSKQKTKDFVQLKKTFKKNTPMIYRSVFYRSFYTFVSMLPKICITPICKLIKKILNSKIPWE